MNKYAKGRVKLIRPNQTQDVVERIDKKKPMFCHNMNVKLTQEETLNMRSTKRQHMSYCKPVKNC